MADKTFPNLRTHNVIIDESPCTEQDELPSHIEDIRLALLDFTDACIPSALVEEWIDTSHAVAAGQVDTSDMCLDIPQCAILPKRYDIGKRATEVREQMNTCRNMAADFHHLVNELEAGLQHYFESKIFRGTFEVAREMGTSHGRSSPGWILNSQAPWNETFKCLENISGSKPDLTYGLRMFTPDVKVPAGRSDWIPVRNLSSEYLLSLRQDEELYLQTSVTKRLSDQELEKFDKQRYHHFLCFPFATVEFKVADVSQRLIEQCYCQVACAAARAISQRLAIHDAYVKSLTNLHESITEQQVLPFIGYTCVGAATRVWLAYPEGYTAGGNVKIKMKCIWSTTTLVAWGVYSLQLIVKNMHTWAIEDFRMKTVHKLEILRHRHRPRPLTRQVSALARHAEGLEDSGEGLVYTERQSTTDSPQVAKSQADHDSPTRASGVTSSKGLFVTRVSESTKEQYSAVPINNQAEPAVSNQANTSTNPTENSTPSYTNVSDELAATPKPFTFRCLASSLSFEPSLRKEGLNRVSLEQSQPQQGHTGSPSSLAHDPPAPKPKLRRPQFVVVTSRGVRVPVRLPYHTGAAGTSPTPSGSKAYRESTSSAVAGSQHRPAKTVNSNSSPPSEDEVSSSDGGSASAVDHNLTIHDLSCDSSDPEDETYEPSNAATDSGDDEFSSSSISSAELEYTEEHDAWFGVQRKPQEAKYNPFKYRSVVPHRSPLHR